MNKETDIEKKKTNSSRYWKANELLQAGLSLEVK